MKGYAMTLQAQLKQDLTAAIKAKDSGRKETLRVVLGELDRQGRKALPDNEIIQVLKKLIKSEREVLEQKGGGIESEFIQILERYLPAMADEDEIREWIEQHIDFARYKNKMQAMGEIMRHFGARAEGNRVKTILADL